MALKINGLEGLTDEHIINEVKRGARFVLYQYCISLLIITLKRPSNIYFIRPEENAVTKGLGFSAISFVLGWWGIPWGPIYTVQSLWSNFNGGKDVTTEIMASVSRPQSQR